MKNILLNIYLIIIIFLIPCSLYSQYLRVPEIIQEQDQWCWSGVSSCVLKYYGKNIKQCTIAEYTRTVATWHNFGSVHCCDDPNQGCNYWNYNWGYAGSIQDILIHWGVSNSGVGSAFTLSTIQQEISASRPYIIRWGWTGGGGHFLVGHGVIISSSMLYYMDPWFNEGFHIADYNWVVSGSNHTWTHTNKINTNPVLPGVPVLFFPPNNTINHPLTLTLLWRKSDRTTSYCLQVASDTNFVQLAVNDSTITDSLRTVGPLVDNSRYYWRVRAKGPGGMSEFSNVWNFNTLIIGIELISSEIPARYKLYNNYPNPFNPMTKISFDLPAVPGLLNTNVKLTVFDLLGRKIVELVDNELRPGKYVVTWDAALYSSGLYFYKLQAGNYSDTKKMVLVR